MADYADLLAAEQTRKNHEAPVQVNKVQVTVEKSDNPSPTQITLKPKENVKKPQPGNAPGKNNDKSVNLPINRLINQSINQLTENLDRRLMSKPKGFYISERLDKRLDKAVGYYEEKHHLKIDRSILLGALLDTDSVWEEQNLDTIIDQLIDQLTRRLTNR